MISQTSQTEEGGYPREDKCKYCGQHLGWVLHPMAEAFALGVCDKAECGQKYEEDLDVGN